MKQDASFGGWLARRRLSLGLSRAALAQRAGCAAVTLRKIEEDARRPSPELAAKLAEHIGISSDDWERFVQVARGIRTVAWLPPAEQEAATRAVAPEMPLVELPAPATRLIGRSSELAALGSLLRGEATRLLVVTGPGGVGKTRLAIHAAAMQRSAFRDGVAFVALAALRDAALVVPTIAQALRLRERGGRTLLELLVDYLRPRQLLLVLDNFEHVASAGRAVAALLASAPRLKLLITSRSVLHLYGEHDIVVRPLALPSASVRSTLEQTRQSEAIQLFTKRAQAAAPFALTAENAPVLAAICRRLDGLPLALELVASWTRVLPLAAIAERLTGAASDARLHLANSGPHNLPDRQWCNRPRLAGRSKPRAPSPPARGSFDRLPSRARPHRGETPLRVPAAVGSRGAAGCAQPTW